MGYAKSLVLRCLSRILDGEEFLLVVDEAESKSFLEELWRALRARYGERGARKIALRLIRSLDAEDPDVAERVRRAWGWR